MSWGGFSFRGRSSALQSGYKMVTAGPYDVMAMRTQFFFYVGIFGGDLSTPAVQIMAQKPTHASRSVSAAFLFPI